MSNWALVDMRGEVEPLAAAAPYARTLVIPSAVPFKNVRQGYSVREGERMYLALQNGEVVTSLATSVHRFKVLDDGRRVESSISTIGIRVVLGVVLDEDETLSLRPQRRDRRLEARAIAQRKA